MYVRKKSLAHALSIMTRSIKMGHHTTVHQLVVHNKFQLLCRVCGCHKYRHTIYRSCLDLLACSAAWANSTIAEVSKGRSLMYQQQSGKASPHTRQHEKAGAAARPVCPTHPPTAPPTHHADCTGSTVQLMMMMGHFSGYDCSRHCRIYLCDYSLSLTYPA